MDKVPFKEAFLFWLKLGFISFGGPAGQIAIMHEYLVEKKKWISEKRFLHALNYCMLLPGPEAQQLATYTGWLMHGTKGGLTAGLLFILPSVFILLGLSVLYVTFGKILWVSAVFNGLKPAVVAIVVAALYKIGKKSLHTPFHYLIALAAFTAISFLHVPFPLIIAGALMCGVLTEKFIPALNKRQEDNGRAAEVDDSLYLINASSVIPWTKFSAQRFAAQAALVLVLWLLPFALYKVLFINEAFWQQLSVFFTKAALVTFGGAYAVLPYVAQVSVEKFNWLTQYEMLDGLALGETTPGPLIMVLAFVGFMAGFHQYHSLWTGAAGLLVTVYYTFLPCFFFIFAGAPLIEKTHTNAFLKKILEPVTAAVAGVVLNLAIYLGIAVLFPRGFGVAGLNYPALVWIGISLLALWRFNANMLLWILVSALFGGLCYMAGIGK